MDKKIALFIDGDNVSAAYADDIMKLLAQRGEVVVKRVYGDWSNKCKNWKKAVPKHLFEIKHQINYAPGKNCTDVALAIDVMEVLYRKQIDVFCIVSSDSDFTTLAIKLRSCGKPVIGMSEKTNDNFKAACSEHITLKPKTEQPKEETKPQKKDANAPKRQKQTQPPKEKAKPAQEQPAPVNAPANATATAPTTVTAPATAPVNAPVLATPTANATAPATEHAETEPAAEPAATASAAQKAEQPQLTPLEEIERVVTEYVQKEKEKGKDKVLLTNVGDEIKLHYPAIKYADYGCKGLEKLLAKLNFKLHKDKTENGGNVCYL